MNFPFIQTVMRLYKTKYSCSGCRFVGNCGDKEVSENCFSCFRALLIRGEIYDNYSPHNKVLKPIQPTGER